MQRSVIGNDVTCITGHESCRFRDYEHSRLEHLVRYLDSTKGNWNQVLKPKAPDQDKALGSEVLDKVETIGGALESLEEQLKMWKTGLELWPLFCDVTSLIDGTLQLIESFKLPPIYDDVLDLTDAGPGVGVSNTHVRYRYAEIARLHNSTRRNRIHRARNDSGQNEAERTNAAIGANSKIENIL